MAPERFQTEPPSEREALGNLADRIGAPLAEQLWDTAARNLGLTRPLDCAADLRQMTDYLMEVGDLMRVAARSTKVRVITHEAINRSVLP